MSKKYKHKNPHTGDPLLRIENNALRTKLQSATDELETLQTALRLFTSADKEDLLNAVEIIERQKNGWYTVGTSGVTTTTWSANVDDIGTVVTIGGSNYVSK